MDAQLDPRSSPGSRRGCYVVRNGGERATDDAIRSLVISYRLLATREWFAIGHTMGKETFTNEVMCELLAGSLESATLMAHGKTRGGAAAREKDLANYGYIYDVRSGRLNQVPEATRRGTRAVAAQQRAGEPPWTHAPVRDRREREVSDLYVRFAPSVRRHNRMPRALANRPDDDTTLKRYALYKQAAQRDAKGERPGGCSTLWDVQARTTVAGLSSDGAMRQYVDLGRVIAPVTCPELKNGNQNQSA